MGPQILVARPRQHTNRPVAKGSSVPVWPALRASSARLARCKAWKLDKPSGLSSNKTPSSICPRREAIVYKSMKKNDSLLRLLVRILGFRGLEHFSLRPIGLIDQLRQGQAASELVVVDEAQGGHSMDVQHLEQQGMQPACFLGQGCSGRFWLGTHDREIDLGVGVVGRELDTRKCNKPGPRYIEFALYQAGQILLDLIGQPGIASRIWFGLVSTHYYSVRAISLISKTSSWSPTSISLLPLRVIPQSKPDLTSLTSSLKRRRESIQPVQCTTWLRNRRTWASRRTTPSVTIQPAILPIRDTL